MSRGQIIALGTCVVLLAGIFLFGKRTKPKDDKGENISQSHATAPMPDAFNIEDYLAQVNLAITDKAEKDSIETFTKTAQYRKLIAEYQKIDKPLAIAYYSTKMAGAENKEYLYLSAGDYNSMLLQSAPDEKAKRFLSANAIECYKSAVALDTAKTENRIRLAGAYMEEGTQPMQGVGILLDIVRKDSNNVDAQLMLGRFGLISGQTDKAIIRLEKILYLQPQNSEALFLLAQAYDSQGNKQKALDLLEKCKKTVHDPQAKKEIETFIENIKKPKG